MHDTTREAQFTAGQQVGATSTRRVEEDQRSSGLSKASGGRLKEERWETPRDEVETNEHPLEIFVPV